MHASEAHSQADFGRKLGRNLLSGRARL